MEVDRNRVEHLKRCLDTAMEAVNYVEEQSCDILDNYDKKNKIDVELYDIVYKINQKAHESKKIIQTYCLDSNDQMSNTNN